MDQDVANVLNRETMPLDPQSNDELVEHEERSPGSVRSTALKIFDRPDGPLKPVDTRTQCQRVAETAQARWSVGAGSIAQPDSMAALVELLERAKADGKSLRFVGSARSLSRAPQPAANGTLVSTCAYGRELPVETDTLRDGIDPAGLYAAEAGRVLADTLIDLDNSNRALADMGSGDFQALAGALSTSTHGSGMRFGSFPGLVRSLDVVTHDETGAVVKRRIEPCDGISDPAKFAARHRDDGLSLIQDDRQFNAWTVSLGCLGPIYSVVFDVIPTYWLHETRTTQWWSEVKQQMDHDLNNVDYYEILVSTWPEDNAGVSDHRCLVTRRNIVRDPAEQRRSGGRPLSMALVQTPVGRVAAAVDLVYTIRNPLKRVSKMLHTGVTATQVSGYTDKWFEILLLRMDVNANSAELGVPLVRTSAAHVDPTNAIRATECMLALDRHNQAHMQAMIGSHREPFIGAFDQLCQAWRTAPLHTSPISLRFVKEEQAFLSMQVGQPTCMIELPMPGVDAYDRRLGEQGFSAPTRAQTRAPELKFDSKNLRLYQSYVEGRDNLFRSVERTLIGEFDVRPHWGQFNTLDWATTERLYPDAAKWRAIYEIANQHGMFDNPLTDQLGISRRS